jgi:hypothetical protein
VCDFSGQGLVPCGGDHVLEGMPPSLLHQVIALSTQHPSRKKLCLLESSRSFAITSNQQCIAINGVKRLKQSIGALETVLETVVRQIMTVSPHTGAGS